MLIKRRGSTTWNHLYASLSIVLREISQTQKDTHSMTLFRSGIWKEPSSWQQRVARWPPGAEGGVVGVAAQGHQDPSSDEWVLGTWWIAWWPKLLTLSVDLSFAGQNVSASATHTKRRLGGDGCVWTCLCWVCHSGHGWQIHRRHTRSDLSNIPQ